MRPVVQAFKDAALSDAGLAGLVFVAEVTGTAPSRYALIFPSSPDREVSRATGPQSELTYSFTVHSVGNHPDSAMWVAERFTAAVIGKRLNPAWGRVRHVGGEPMRRDDSVAPGVHFLVDEFEIVVG